MTSFIHLHVHSECSLLKGQAKITTIVRTAREMAMPALAITDKDKMYGAMDFYREAKRSGIKPILGCEVTMAPYDLNEPNDGDRDCGYPLVLLARDERGYKNLIKLLFKKETEKKAEKPHIRQEYLETLSQGLIALSGSLSGEIATMILKGDKDGALRIAEHYSSIFGKNYFYLELQDHGLKNQQIVNQALAAISKETGIPLVATNNVHYLKKEDAEIQKILHFIENGKTTKTEDFLNQSDQFYFKNHQEMSALFQDYPEAISNTLKIAEECELNLDSEIRFFPCFTLPEEKSAADYLKEISVKGLRERYSEPAEIIRERLDYELETIKKAGAADSMLILWDLIRHAREKGITVGPGFGNMPGSLVAYTLKITGVDPVKYGIYAERFINPEKVSPPILDIECADSRRDELINYLQEKYGYEKVAGITKLKEIGAKTAVEVAGRYLQFSEEKIKQITGLIPPDDKDAYLFSLETFEEDFQALYEGEEVKKIIDTAIGIEGIKYQRSNHDNPVIISPEPLFNYLPLETDSNGKMMTQYDEEYVVEMLGLKTINIRGAKKLDLIDKTIKNIEQKDHLSIDIESIPLNDPATYQLLSGGETDGIYDFETSHIKEAFQSLKPDSIEDITSIIALDLSAPLSQYSLQDLIDSQNGDKPIEYLHPDFESILKGTYGLLIYYEQASHLAAQFADFSFVEADQLRRILGKRKKQLKDEQKELFIKRSVAKGYEEEIASNVFLFLEKYNSQAFPKTHALARALTIYRTAYLKANHKTEFMAALSDCQN